MKKKADERIDIRGGSPQLAAGEKARNIQTERYYENYYEGVTPRQAGEDELKRARVLLRKMPTDRIPEPAAPPAVCGAFDAQEIPNERENS